LNCSAKEHAVSLTELFARLPHRFGKAGLIDKFPPETSQALVRHFSVSDPDMHEVEFAGASVKFHRADGRIEAATAAGARVSEAMRLELEQFFGPKDGFGRVERINTLDGLRVWFSNGDIAHVRPSGNAPQLRIYAVADSLSRVEQIVALGLREPDGILRNLESAAGRYAAEEKVR